MCSRSGTVSLCCQYTYSISKNGSLMKENKHLPPKINKVLSGVETKCAKGKVFFNIILQSEKFYQALDM